MNVLEVCVDDVAGLHAAVQGGADRIELCSCLDLGGLTPSTGLMAEARHAGVPVIALIRPRSGGFVYTEAEERVMLHDIQQAAAWGLAGVAIGALTPEGALDVALLERLARAAHGLQLTLHRAFDLVRDRSCALEAAIALGFQRILTSGGALKAPDGAAQLAALVAQSRGRIAILAGSGVNAHNVGELLSSTGVQEVHASCSHTEAAPAAELLAFGFAASPRRATSATLVKALKAQLLAQDLKQCRG